MTHPNAYPRGNRSCGLSTLIAKTASPTPPAPQHKSPEGFAVRAISAGLRLEVGPKIRVCCIEPGSNDRELKYNTTGLAQKTVLDLYKKTAIPASTIARAIGYAIEQPAEVDINEIIVRPTAQTF